MKYKVGFIGYGKMAKAIAGYLKKNGFEQIFASDPFAASDETVRKVETNTELARLSDIIFLSIKPQNAKEALHGIDFSNKIIISIMAGLNINKIRSFGNNMNKVIRVMPNLCAAIGKSVNAYAAMDISDNERDLVVSLLDSFGTVYEINESDFDTITGLTGSGPAFIFKYIKNVITAGQDNGFDFENAKNTVLDMIEGSTELLRKTTNIDEINTMIENVCSKGGTTIEGIHTLDAGNFDNNIKSAINSVIRRSKELGKE